MSSTSIVPQIADIAPLPWGPTLHNLIQDADGRPLLEVKDYWLREENDEAVHDDDKTRAIAWYVLDAVNSHAALVAALHAALEDDRLRASTRNYIERTLAAALGRAGGIPT